MAADVHGGWSMAPSPLEACIGADAVIVVTEWQQYFHLDWQAIYAVMRKPAWLFDARAIADGKAALAAGMQVWTVGEG